MNDDYLGVLLEDIDAELDAVLESQSTTATALQLKAVGCRLTRIESDVKIIKRVVTEKSHDLNRHDTQLKDHEGQITALKK